MIKIVTTDKIELTKIEFSDFGDVLQTVLPQGTELTIWLTAPTDIGGGLSLKWEINLMMWVGDESQKDTSPSVIIKEVSKKYKIALFNSDGSFKYPFVRSEKDYILGMVEDQNRLVVQFFYDNGIFPQGSLEIVGI